MICDHGGNGLVYTSKPQNYNVHSRYCLEIQNLPQYKKVIPFQSSLSLSLHNSSNPPLYAQRTPRHDSFMPYKSVNSIIPNINRTKEQGKNKKSSLLGVHLQCDAKAPPTLPLI